jgi:ubiquinone biosynthesis protein COQ9
MAENFKKLVLDKFIDNVSFDGWSQKNLDNSIQALDLQENYRILLFPDGIAGLTDYFVLENNKAFNDSLNSEEIQKLRFTDKVIFLIHARIKHYHTVLGGTEGFKNFISYCSSRNILNSIGNIFKSADDIWHRAGDKSTDFSYYTKRASLSFIYTTAALYSIDDNSLNLEETNNFIKARVAELLKFNKLKQKAKELTSKLPSFGLFDKFKVNNKKVG